MNVLDKLEYGLFVLSAHENQKDNACITNVAMQVTDNPIRIAFTVNKNNLTHDMIFNTVDVKVIEDETIEKLPIRRYSVFSFRKLWFQKWKRGRKI